MAEIKIEKKKPIWPWIILVIILLGILIYVFAFDNSNDDIDNSEDIEKLNDTSSTLDFKQNTVGIFKSKDLIS